MNTTYEIRVPGLPRTCRHCGEQCDHFALVPFANQIALVCEHCYSRNGRLIAVPDDADTAAEPELAAAVPGGLRVAYRQGDDRP